MQSSEAFESDVHQLIKERRSRRAYTSQPIEAEKIKSLFEAARWAPSSVNEQPWTYIYATSDQPLWHQIFDTLNDRNKIWAKDAPLLVASLAKQNFSRDGSFNAAAHYDVGAANAFLSLQATHLGLNVHQLGGFDKNALRANLNIPDTFDIGVVLAIGYSGDPSQLPDYLREREVSARTRKQQSEFVMNQAFENRKQ